MNEFRKSAGAESDPPRRGLMSKDRFLREIEAQGLEQRFFKILVEGTFSVDKVSTLITNPGDGLRRSDATEAIIEREWQKHIAAGNKPWPNDLRPTRYHFADWEVTDAGELQIALDPSVSYRDFIGARAPELFEGPKAFFPDPLAASTALIASDRSGDEFVLLTVRSPAHDYKPGGYHILGGYMDVRKDTSPTDTAFRESEEECGISKSEILELNCHGIMRNLTDGHADVIYSARASVPAEEVLKRSNDGENEVILVPLTPGKLREWIIVPTHANVVATSAALLMVGKSLFSRTLGETRAQAWYDELMTMLAFRSKDYGDPDREQQLETRDLARFGIKVRQHRG